MTEAEEFAVALARMRERLAPEAGGGPVASYQNAAAAAQLAERFEALEGAGSSEQLLQVDRLLSELEAGGEGTLAKHALLLFAARWKHAAGYGLRIPRLGRRLRMTKGDTE